MSYEKIIQKASFRGINFHVESSERKMGFNYKIHVFPGGKRKAYAEELSEQAQILPIDAFLIGPDAAYTRDLLIEACRKRTPGKLHHPQVGYIDAKCKSFRVREVFNKVGKIIISMEFIEVEQESSSMFPDFGIQDLLNSADEMLTEAALELTENLSVLDMPAYAVATVTKVMDRIGSIISSNAGFGRIPDSANDLADAFKSLVINSDKIRVAVEILHVKFNSLMNKLNIGQVQQVQNAFILKKRPANFDELSSTEQKEIKTNEAITRYVCVASLICSCGLYSIRANSDTNKTQLQNQLSSIDSLLESATDNQYEKLTMMKILFQRFLDQLKTAPTVTIKSPTPSLLVAYDYCGDIRHEQLLIEKNDIANPFAVYGEIKCPMI